MKTETIPSKALLYALALTGTIALSGCASTQTVSQTKVITQIVPANPPKSLYDCFERHLNVPNADTLTDRQVGKYIVDSQRIINECQSDSKSLDQYLKQSTANIRKVQTAK